MPIIHLAQPVYECLKSLVERTPAGQHAAALAEQYFRHPSRVFRARDWRPGLRILIVECMVSALDCDAGWCA